MLSYVIFYKDCFIFTSEEFSIREFIPVVKLGGYTWFAVFLYICLCARDGSKSAHVLRQSVLRVGQEFQDLVVGYINGLFVCVRPPTRKDGGRNNRPDERPPRQTRGVETLFAVMVKGVRVDEMPLMCLCYTSGSCTLIYRTYQTTQPPQRSY